MVTLDRRKVLVLGAGAFVVGGLPLAVRRERTVRRAVPLMGTIADVAVMHRDPAVAHAAIDRALAALHRVDRTMTRHVSTSEIGRVNDGATREGVAVSPATAAVLREALLWAETSDGAFDPAIGRAIRLWDVEHRVTPPATRDVRRLAGRRLHRALDVDTWRGATAVRFADADVAVDLGGVAKGYGVDQAIDALRAHGIERGVITVGGDLYALGEPERGAGWTVGIRSPEDPSRVIDTVSVSNAAVATSGDYFRYFVHAGRRYHHILDPRTGEPRRTVVRSVTVTAGTCMTADAAATTAFGMSRVDADRVLALRGARVLRVIDTSV